jgi:protein AbiQ
MNRLCFYEVNVQYTDFLRKYGDSRIPYISYQGHHRFLCGILFENNGMSYFAPISSYTHPQKSNIIIKDTFGKDIGSIRFSFMFPVPLHLVQKKDFSLESASYRRLLDKEYYFCSIYSEIIIERAKYIYHNVKEKKDATLVKNCCDFDSLEKAYHLYCILFDV